MNNTCCSHTIRSHISAIATPATAQLAEAWIWQGEASNRYALLSDDMSLECFDISKAEPVGRAHGRDWRLYSEDARQASCAAPDVPVTRFDYSPPGAAGDSTFKFGGATRTTNLE